MKRFNILLKEKGSNPYCTVSVFAKDIGSAEEEVIEMYKDSRYDYYYSYYGGEGLPRKDKKGSVYTIKYGEDDVATFTNRKQAIKFYKQQKSDKSFWCQVGFMELMDCVVWRPLKT